MNRATHNCRVLFVEDDENHYVLIQDYLSRCRTRHYALEWQPDPDQALRDILTQQHDLVLLDYRLGGNRNGLELLRSAKEQGCLTPIILLTSFGDHQLDEEAMEAGAADYLYKNEITADLLDRSLRYAMAHREAEDRMRRFNEELEQKVKERTAQLQSSNQDLKQEIQERKRAENERERVIDQLQEALANVKTLSGLLPICSHCKNIRDDQGYWKRVEEYIRQRSDAEFTHSICPKCLETHYPEYRERGGTNDSSSSGGE